MQDRSSIVAIARYMSHMLRHVCCLRLAGRQAYGDNSRSSMSLIHYTNLHSEHAMRQAD
jgi:hypothetical protein